MREFDGYAIGEQDFRLLREKGALYIDKTQFIAKMLKSKSKYFFLARPRRFGKSLFLSTLRYFFEGKQELFKNLHIDTIDWNWAEHPVLRLDLNTDRYSSLTEFEEVIGNIFRAWEEKYKVEVSTRSLSQRFKNIIEGAYRHTGRRVVILVDEYDKPLVGNMNVEDNFTEFRESLAAIYSNFKSSSEFIEFVFLTGVSRFSKLSVFSDLNNLRDITFSDEYSDICGITEKELIGYFQEGIGKLAAKSGINTEEALRLLKENYDGYRFAPDGSDIYNPWSVLNAMQESRIGNYWNSTGMPTLIAETLKNLDVNLEEIFDSYCTLSMLEGLDLQNPYPVALLYQTGYLTIKCYDAEIGLYRLGIPNKEVTDGLFKILLPYYVKVRRGGVDGVVVNLIKYMQMGEPEKMVASLDSFLAGIPYDMKMEDENNFHNALYILLTLIGLNAETEVHTSDGRIDLVIKTKKFIYIIELKFAKDSCTAIAQIDEKEYHKRYLNDSRRIFKIGMNFSPQTRRIDAPSIEEVRK